MGKIKILIVEDQKTTSKVIQRELIQVNYEVTSIIDFGEKVLEEVGKNPPDLVLMDIVLKGKMDGIEAVKQMHAVFDIPVVYLTAYADDERFERAKLTNPFGYLIKPFEARELNTTIKAALHKHHTDKELKIYRDNLEKLVEERTLQLLASKTSLEHERLVKKHTDKHIRQLHRIVEQSPSIVVVTDIEGKIEYTNPAFTKITGYSAVEALGRTPRMLKSGEQPSPTYDKLWETIKSGREWYSEFCNKKKDGDLYRESVYITSLKNSDGIITNFTKTSEDITARKLFEEELKESEAKYMDLYDNAPDMFLSVSAETSKIIDCNKTLVKVSGYTKDEIINHNIFEFYHPECMEYAQEAFLLFQKIGEVKNCELILKCKDGRKIDVLLNVSAVLDSQGNITHSRSVWHDVTECNQVKKELVDTTEKLIHSEKLAAIGKLSASISHEFNNPIAGIRNTLESVADEFKACAPSDDRLLRLVQLSIKETNRMAGLIKDLQYFNRPSSGIFTKDIYVNELIEEVMLMYGKHLKQRNITVEKNCDVDIPLISVISDQIKQVVLNLIQNADEAIPETGGKISINTLHTESKVLIQIQDTGKGIQKELMSSIFEPFISTKASVKGTGLGLSVSYGIIKKHGGEILVKSEVGKGTTFTISLPVKQLIGKELK